MEAKKDEKEVGGWLEDNLPSWELRADQLYGRFDTANWRVTLMAANAIGFLAEAAYHHPRIILNYRSVEIYLTTHDAGGVTQKDFDLALKIEETVRWPLTEGDTPGTRPKDWLRS
ncbi:MAG: 4a-hydroxytetrahydrobiopterin dehydratase [Caldilineaceae bacterium SB0675_bin_29]|uniref:4a-hydroxytetrahydrobiopterin dehydratase n=1 Tax=Caldilineaceae bacterium SB0675_bin_29 TaxID=2605266 RepID=A0A6B1G0W4_9CHLR|nr:4a-hydroxytetrahydrobiopterin dehydratase [Caldilineaceae bacterium SB0675_bin_29]